MTSNPDHDITMTGPETAALAYLIHRLSPDDVRLLLRDNRGKGAVAQAWRRQRGVDPYVNKASPALGQVRGLVSELGALRHKLAIPAATDAAAQAYGRSYLAADDALRALYLDDDATAEAALAALDALESTNA